MCHFCTELLEQEDKVAQALKRDELDWATVSEVFYAEHFGGFADILLSGRCSSLSHKSYAMATGLYFEASGISSPCRLHFYVSRRFLFVYSGGSRLAEFLLTGREGPSLPLLLC